MYAVFRDFTYYLIKKRRQRESALQNKNEQTRAFASASLRSFFFFMMQEISPGNISVISTKAPYGASAMHDRHVRKGSRDSVLHTFVLKISHANVDQTQGDYKNCCRGQLLAIGLPRNRMTFLRRDRNADNIRGSSDRSRAAADIGS